jgi:hypothetical protein
MIMRILGSLLFLIFVFNSQSIQDCVINIDTLAVICMLWLISIALFEINESIQKIKNKD